MSIGDTSRKLLGEDWRPPHETSTKQVDTGQNGPGPCERVSCSELERSTGLDQGRPHFAGSNAAGSTGGGALHGHAGRWR